MTAEQNKAMARRIVEAFNKKDMSMLAELFSPNCVGHSPEGDANFE